VRLAPIHPPNLGRCPRLRKPGPSALPPTRGSSSSCLPSPGDRAGGAGRGAGGEGRAAGRLLVFTLFLFPLLALTACGGRPGEQVETTAPVPVVTQAVRRGAIRRLIPATGIVKPAAGAELLVTVPQAARIAELPKGVGEIGRAHV